LVRVHDGTGTHGNEYLLATDVRGKATVVIETYAGRWNLETTLEPISTGISREWVPCRSARDAYWPPG
jgi:hypothetical protein